MNSICYFQAIADKADDHITVTQMIVGETAGLQNRQTEVGLSLESVF